MKISPSLLAYDNWCDFYKIIPKLNKMNIESIHIDVMDGHFVPNIAFGPDLVKSIKNITNKPLDFHLMISCLDALLKTYIKIKPKIIHIHAEVCNLSHIKQIKDSGILAGIAINPKTNVSEAKKFLSQANYALIMTVEPGFSGQKFMEKMLFKIQEIKKINPNIKCMIDGGVTKEHFDLIKEKKGDQVVMGTAFFNNYFL